MLRKQMVIDCVLKYIRIFYSSFFTLFKVPAELDYSILPATHSETRAKKGWRCQSTLLPNHSGWDSVAWCYWAVQWSWFARVNALCNLSPKKSQEVAMSLLGRFLSRCCFTLCITMEVEPRIAKQYKCHHCCSCKNNRGKGIEGGKNVSLHHFLLTRRSRVPVAWATSYCLLPDTFWLWAPKNVFKVDSVKFADSLSTPSIVKKVCTRSKSSQGT